MYTPKSAGKLAAILATAGYLMGCSSEQKVQDAPYAPNVASVIHENFPSPTTKYGIFFPPHNPECKMVSDLKNMEPEEYFARERALRAEIQSFLDKGGRRDIRVAYIHTGPAVGPNLVLSSETASKEELKHIGEGILEMMCHGHV